MKRPGDDLLLESLEREEDQILSAADALDGKGGMLIAAASFLAVQPSVLLLIKEIPAWAFIFQALSFIALSVGCIIAYLALKVTGYLPPGFTEEWRDELVTEYPADTPEEVIKRAITWGQVKATKQRIVDGRRLNDQKAKLIQIARSFTTSAFVLNTVIIVAIFVYRVLDSWHS